MSGNNAHAVDLESGDSTLFPDFCNNYIILLVILVAELLAIVLTLTQFSSWQIFFIHLAYLSFFLQTIALLDAALLCLLRRQLLKLPAFWTAIIVYIGLQVVTLTGIAIAKWILILLSIDHSDLNYFNNLFISMIITAMIMRYFYVQHQWKRKQIAATQSRIAALQARIRPHFLFNSMNTIANLIYENPQQAENAVLDLADLYRATLAKPEMVTLEQEIRLVNGYLSIERFRLGDRLKTDFDIQDDCWKYKMPSMMLQPLIENAIYHGIESISSGGTLVLKADIDKTGFLKININNPIPGFPKATQRPGNHMAVDNILQRLMLTYGKEAYLKSSKIDQTYSVELCVPHYSD